MNQVDDKEIERLAVLSRLRLTDAEAKEMAAHIGNMIKFLSVIDAIDTSKVSPTAHILSAVNVLRDDMAYADIDRAALLSRAPENDGEAFIVPAVIE